MGAFKYEFLQAYRRRTELINPVVFFVMVCSMFPLALGSNAEVLAPLASGVIWVAAVLATLLSLDQMFRQDFDEGVLEQMELSEVPFYQIVAFKILAHWCLTGLPLVILSPLLAMMLFMPEQSYLSLILSLFLGTPILSLVGAIGAALTVKIRRGNMVLSLLILPLYVPVLIFGATAPLMAASGDIPLAQLLWLGAILVLMSTLAPLVASFGLRINIYGS